MASLQPLLPSAANYPEPLKTIPDPPVLYWQGTEEAWQRPMVSVVGSRQLSGYGEAALRLLVPPLVRAGFTIVSGLAYGADAIAHQLVLESGGFGIAVLGSGLDRIYPAKHEELAKQLVAQGGALLSEYPPTAPPLTFHFPQRNRIIAGLSQLTLVVEAGERSGGLITARLARDYGREVAIVLGQLNDDHFSGSYQIYRDGAHVVGSAQDLLDILGSSTITQARLPLQPALTGTAAAVYDCILRGQTSLDLLLKATKLAPAQLQSVLSLLELDGYLYHKHNQWLLNS